MTIKDKPLSPSVNKGRILRMRQLLEKLPLSESRIHALIQSEQFPKPFKLIEGGRAIGWYESDVDAFLEQRSRGEK